MYNVKIKFEAYDDSDQWGSGRKGFEYKWQGEIPQVGVSSFLDDLRELINDQYNEDLLLDLPDWLNDDREVDEALAAVE